METKKCPYCGEEIMAVAKKCKHCGEWLDDEHEKEMSATTAAKPLQQIKKETKPRMFQKDGLKISLLFFSALVCAIVAFFSVIIESYLILQEWEEPIISSLMVGIVLLIILSAVIINVAIRQKNIHRAELIMMAVNIVALGITVSLFIGKSLWRAGVINGKYGINIYPFYDQASSDAESTYHALSLLICLIAFCAISIVIFKWLKNKKSIKRMSLYLGVISVLVLGLIFKSIFTIKDESWYYESEKVLQHNIETYTNYIVQLHDLVQATSQKISQDYSDFLTGQISYFTRGGQEPLPPTASLQQKSERFRELKDWLEECQRSEFCNQALIIKYNSILNAQEEFAERTSAAINKEQFEELQKNIMNLSYFLEKNRVFSIDIDYHEKRNDLEHLGNTIISMSEEFTQYPKRYKYAVDNYGFSNEAVTTKMQDRLADFDNQFQEYKANSYSN